MLWYVLVSPYTCIYLCIVVSIIFSVQKDCCLKINVAMEIFTLKFLNEIYLYFELIYLDCLLLKRPYLNRYGRNSHHNEMRPDYVDWNVRLLCHINIELFQFQIAYIPLATFITYRPSQNACFSKTLSSYPENDHSLWRTLSAWIGNDSQFAGILFYTAKLSNYFDISIFRIIYWIEASLQKERIHEYSIIRNVKYEWLCK